MYIYIYTHTHPHVRHIHIQMFAVADKRGAHVSVFDSIYSAFDSRGVHIIHRICKYIFDLHDMFHIYVYVYVHLPDKRGVHVSMVDSHGVYMFVNVYIYVHFCICVYMYICNIYVNLPPVHVESMR